MALSNKEKTELMKKIIIKRIENIGTKAALKTFMKNLTWQKIKNLLDQELQVKADQLGIDSQGSLDKRAAILALKAEKDEF